MSASRSVIQVSQIHKSYQHKPVPYLPSIILVEFENHEREMLKNIKIHPITRKIQVSLQS